MDGIKNYPAIQLSAIQNRDTKRSFLFDHPIADKTQNRPR
jgi:hypothetical protein